MITPEEAWQKFINWFDIRKRLAFLVTFFVGIVTHITIITEMVMSQDGLWNSIQYFRPGAWETTLGRWGIAIVERLNNFIAIPTVATISCLLAMAIAVVFLIDIFNLKSKLSIILTSLVVAVTPTLTITLLYIYKGTLRYPAEFSAGFFAAFRGAVRRRTGTARRTDRSGKRKNKQTFSCERSLGILVKNR